MRPMRPERELYLHKQFVRINVLRVACKSVLPANLGKLAGPVGQHQGSALVIESGIEWTVGAVHARAREPAPDELVAAWSVKAEGPLESRPAIRRTDND